MSKMYRVASHNVDAVQILRIQPLMGRNTQVMSPDAGLLLVLSDETKQTWLSEKGSIAPTVGDFLVTDTVLNLSYVVAAANFQKMFRSTK
jgi:hypothetical protein